MSNDKDKLKLIENELKDKAAKLESLNKLIQSKVVPEVEKELENKKDVPGLYNLYQETTDGKLTFAENTELFLVMANLINEAYDNYISSKGYEDGCKEAILHLVDAKEALSVTKF